MANRSVEVSAPGVYRLRTLMANLFFVQGDGRSWVLVDTGVRGYAGAIERLADELFPGERPLAIILTHAHFDHVGGLPALATRWSVPVYVHPLELPFVTGRASYQPPDPTVGGGLNSILSPLFPRRPIDLGARAAMLPADGSVPGAPGWRWIATPGHSPGHVSLFRDADRTLIAGDAVVTTRQESFTDVLVQRPMVWRPPAYFTADWDRAGRSVAAIAALEPEVLATGHGRTMRGPEMRWALNRLAERFLDSMPSQGRYVREPAVADESGFVYVPPPTTANYAFVIGAAVAAGAGLWSLYRPALRRAGRSRGSAFRLAGSSRSPRFNSG